MEEFLQRKMKRDRVPGLAAALVNNDGMAWYGEFGFADLERRIPMTIDHLLNIGSISKTVTATALLQLCEEGLFRLDDDVGDYVDFSLRNPGYPDRSISFRHLLTHQSSLRDGPQYARAYQCGDPATSVSDWVESNLSPAGDLCDIRENYHDWPPGEGWDYCNIAFGLIAYLVENLSGVSFSQYCETSILEPLGMREASWFLKDIDTSRHAVLYTLVESGEARGPAWGGIPLGVLGAPKPPSQLTDGFHANCLYGHPNFPDGFLRCSIRTLARYVQAYLKGDGPAGPTLLQPSTSREMMREQTRYRSRVQGLAWYARHSGEGELLWGHAGSDPGIETDVRFRFSDATAVVVFANTNGARIYEVTERLLQDSDALLT